MNRKFLSKIVLILAFTLTGIGESVQQAKSADANSWWLTPQRLLQTNLREIDATMDTDQYVREVKEFDVIDDGLEYSDTRETPEIKHIERI
jgi:hypothetical protein